jgi:hypothetical protein
VGRQVYLAVYTHFSSLPDNTRVLVEWKVRQGAGVVGYDSQQRVLGHADTGTLRSVWRFSPRHAGTYTVAARVTVGSSAMGRTIALNVKRR